MASSISPLLAAGMGAMGASSAGAMGSSAPLATDAPKAPARLTDAEIGAVMDAANNGEIEEAKVAQKSGQNAGVKSFATMMVTHHTEARDKQAKLFSKLALSPTENAKSRDVKAEGQKNLDTIKTLKGADFDRAYIDAQVKEHTAVLKSLDEDILPVVQSAEYKTLLQDVRGKVEQHLKAAQDLQTKLGKTGG
ncbi:MAG: DUF4142 domain-containing protein [Myxococcales bacterium]|nr:MAG: DUF4142 domain-containing protein [Myxococcales bacterium]